MEERFATSFAQLERTKEVFIDRINQFPDDQVELAPSHTEWSPKVVLEHILIVEYNTLKYMKYMTDTGHYHLKRSTREHQLNSERLIRALGLDERFVAPPDLPVPKDARTREEIIVHWARVRNHYRDWLETKDLDCASRLIFKHPYGGWFDLWQTFDFLDQHIIHHMFQLDRIQKSLNP